MCKGDLHIHAYGQLRNGVIHKLFATSERVPKNMTGALHHLSDDVIHIIKGLSVHALADCVRRWQVTFSTPDSLV